MKDNQATILLIEDERQMRRLRISVNPKLLSARMCKHSQHWKQFWIDAYS